MRLISSYEQSLEIKKHMDEGKSFEEAFDTVYLRMYGIPYQELEETYETYAGSMTESTDEHGQKSFVFTSEDCDVVARIIVPVSEPILSEYKTNNILTESTLEMIAVGAFIMFGIAMIIFTVYQLVHLTGAI
jgi:hypothetical protein